MQDAPPSESTGSLVPAVGLADASGGEPRTFVSTLGARDLASPIQQTDGKVYSGAHRDSCPQQPPTLSHIPGPVYCILCRCCMLARVRRADNRRLPLRSPRGLRCICVSTLTLMAPNASRFSTLVSDFGLQFDNSRRQAPPNRPRRNRAIFPGACNCSLRLVSLPVYGQSGGLSLSLDSASVSPGATATLSLHLGLTGTATPAALQWTFHYPSTAFTPTSAWARLQAPQGGPWSATWRWSKDVYSLQAQQHTLSPA